METAQPLSNLFHHWVHLLGEKFGDFCHAQLHLACFEFYQLLISVKGARTRTISIVGPQVPSEG